MKNASRQINPKTLASSLQHTLVEHPDFLIKDQDPKRTLEYQQGFSLVTTQVPVRRT